MTQAPPPALRRRSFPGSVASGLAGAFLSLAGEPVHAVELTGAITACHDPSSIVKDQNGYWIFSTAPNLNVRHSTNLIQWQSDPRAFAYSAGVPPWMQTILTSLEGNVGPWNLWAPEVVPYNGAYRLYYSRNMGFDTAEVSGLGLATRATITGGPAWADQGTVITTDLFDDDFRVIDPTVIIDQTGRHWLACGSFGSPTGEGYAAGGIRIFELDPATGKRLNANDQGTRIAGSWIEAPYLHYHDGFYYLFFNQGGCCAGLNSTYYVRVGRSASITGPYVDMRGNSLLNPTHGGTLFLGRDDRENYSNGTPTDNFGSVGYEIGPGHIGILAGEDAFDRFSYHYYDGDTPNGEPTLGLRTMAWTESGWPRAGYDLQGGNYAIFSQAGDGSPAAEGSGYLDLFNDTGTTPIARDWDGSRSQVWNVERVGTNEFRIRSTRTNQVLAANANGTVTMVEYSAANTAHRWFAEQTSDRTFRFLNRATNQALTFGDGAVSTSPWANDTTQRWWIVPTGIYWLRNDYSGLAAGIPNNTAGTRVDQFSYFESPLQQWRFLPLKGGHSLIESVGSGLVLGLASSGNGAGIVQQVRTGASAQQWDIEPLTDGSHRLINRQTAFVLDIPSPDPLALAEQSEWAHVRDQQWSPQLLDVSPLGLQPEEQATWSVY